MPEFIVTDPTGKEHVVNAPEGATQEQALEFAKSKFAATPGGAALGNPSITGQAAGSLKTAPDTFGEAAAKIGGAGGVGALAGAFAPELLTGAAGLATASGFGAPVAPFLLGAGSAIRGARLASAIAGGIGGVAGETAGQVAEGLGAGPMTAEAVRFVGGGIGPETLNAAKFVLDKYLKTPALSLASKFKKETAKQILAQIEGDPKSLGQKEREYLDGLTAELRGGEKTDQPMRDVYGGLEAGATKARSVSSQEANDIITNAERAASMEISGAMKGDVARRRAALPKLEEIGAGALEAARAQRAAIGADREASDIGGELRGAIVGRNQAALGARKAEFAATQQERDAIVKQAEGTGKYVNSMPEYKALIASLQAEAAPGKRSTDVAGNFEHILRSVSNPEKDVFGQPKPVSFQVLDDVRRKLGEVFNGNAPEGYKAIDADTARRYYARISEIQKKFAGEPQERLLSQYADASEGLQMFGSKAGKRATAVDRYDDERFVTDAGLLPRQFFKSKQGVQDLIDLTGDKALVVKAGREFAANELRDATEAQTRAWMTKNRDWLTTSPEGRDVWSSVAKYADALQRGERVSANAAKGGKLVQAAIGDKISEAERAAGVLRKTGEREASAVTAEGDRIATALMGDKFPVERVRQLIESGSREQWALAAPAIQATPASRQNIEAAVRQVIADRAERSTRGLSDFYARNVRPALEAGQLIAPQQADEIASKLAAIEAMQIPEPAKLGIAKRLMLQSIGGYAAGATARGAVTLSQPDEVPQAGRFPQTTPPPNSLQRLLHTIGARG